MNTKQQILDFFEARDKIEQVVKDYVQDKSIALDDRWEVFQKSGFGSCPSWVQHLKSLHDDICIYDGLVPTDRHQNVCVFDILERYQDDLSNASLYDDEWNTKNLKQWQKYNFNPEAFKKECLEKFIKGWVYDW
jgi:hypothetical protein